LRQKEGRSPEKTNPIEDDTPVAIPSSAVTMYPKGTPQRQHRPWRAIDHRWLQIAQSRREKELNSTKMKERKTREGERKKNNEDAVPLSRFPVFVLIPASLSCYHTVFRIQKL